jgi:hypothetical protein
LDVVMYIASEMIPENSSINPIASETFLNCYQ